MLEVGTGTGSLTAAMADAAAAVVTVEIDPQLFALAAEELHARANVLLLQADVLKNKNRINPIVLDAVDERLRAAPARRFKLVANLPYNVATPILGNLLALDVPPRSMTVTIQKELADRIVARPGTKDYGSLSIWIQSQCRAEIVRVMPPSVFWPRPKVDSAIVQIELDDALRGRIADRAFFQSSSARCSSTAASSFAANWSLWRSPGWASPRSTKSSPPRASTAPSAPKRSTSTRSSRWPRRFEPHRASRTGVRVSRSRASGEARGGLRCQSSPAVSRGPASAFQTAGRVVAMETVENLA